MENLLILYCYFLPVPAKKKQDSRRTQYLSQRNVEAWNNSFADHLLFLNALLTMALACQQLIQLIGKYLFARKLKYVAGLFYQYNIAFAFQAFPNYLIVEYYYPGKKRSGLIFLFLLNCLRDRN